MSIVFYKASTMSSASPVSWALAELGVPHETVTFDLAARDQKKPQFLKLNPNGKVPTLVVDGTSMFEGLAIILFLAERYGVDKKLWPEQNDPARMQALSWCVWGYVSLGPLIARLSLATSERFGKELHNAAQAELARSELANLLGILDARLSTRPYMLGDSFSLVDVVGASLVQYGKFSGVLIDPHRHVSEWVARCQSRPAVSDRG
ncbi:MAG: glutathione S-transferase family protein [Polyangiaceae bacterium]|jgi:GST-like protein